MGQSCVISCNGDYLISKLLNALGSVKKLRVIGSGGWNGVTHLLKLD
jgi:hypothetical protein